MDYCCVGRNNNDSVPSEGTLLRVKTGIRVGELVNLNIDDIDLEGRECVVYGKGNKERRVYFDAKAKVHLKRYMEERQDNNEALFVTLDYPYNRLKISGVEIRLRALIRWNPASARVAAEAGR